MPTLLNGSFAPKRKIDECELSWKAAEIATREGYMPGFFAWGDDAIKSDRHIMLPLARDMYQNNAFYSALINRLVLEVIGEDGVELKSKHKRKAVRDLIKSKWLGWCEYADAMKEDDFTELERRIFTEILNVGEILIVKVRENQTLMLIESERIQDIEYLSNGEPKKFIVSNKTGDPTTILAEDAIWICYKRNRKSDGRGSGILWGCMDIIHMLVHILRSSAKSWGVASKIALIITKTEGASVAAALQKQANGDDPDADDDGEEDDAANVAARFIDIEDGTVFVGKPGENAQTSNHNGVPNADLGNHVLTYLRVVSADVGYDAATVLQNDFSKVNYSSAKAANVALSKTVRRWQSFLKRRLYNRVYRWLAGSWMASEESIKEDMSVLTDFNWIMPRPVMIDNKGEAEANEKELALSVTTHDHLILARNGDPESLEDARLAEMERALEKANASPLVQSGVMTSGELTRLLCGIPMGKTQAAETVKQNGKEPTNDDEAQPQGE